MHLMRLMFDEYVLLIMETHQHKLEQQYQYDAFKQYLLSSGSVKDCVKLISTISLTFNFEGYFTCSFLFNRQDRCGYEDQQPSPLAAQGQWTSP